MVNTVTLSTLQAKVSRKLIDANNAAISVASVTDALNDAQHYWKQKPFWFNTKTTTLVMDVNDPYVLGFGNSTPTFQNPPVSPNPPVLPSDFLMEVPKTGFVIPYSNLKYRFKKVNNDVYDDADICGIGLPYIYTYRDGNYEFYFRPNLAYYLTVHYIFDVLDLSASGDNNVFTNNADRLLIYEALSHLFGEDRQDDTLDNAYAKKADREWTLLRKRTADNEASGTLQGFSILD